MRELQPVNQNVLLELPNNSHEQKTASGIIIPDSAKEKEKIAKVVALSNIENPEFAVGDLVLFKDFTGSEVDFDGKKFLFLPYGDILAKVVETEAI
ncbi:MAG TPA: co-chaperone GroES [Prolixibacteraceae bacterium]|nr:co-chaperone GroES [Prolixibacteraceae bacterium]